MQKHWKQWAAVGCALSVFWLCPLHAAAEAQTNGEESSDSGISIDTSGDEKYDVFTYRSNADGGLTITSCDTSASSAEIPGEIEGKTVTAIGDAAFMNCSMLTSVTIPDSVTTIGESAFSSCSVLGNVTLPDGVLTLGDGAFESCTALQTVTLPDSLEKIPQAAFYQCEQLSSVQIPDSITEIGNEAFYSCTGLSVVTLPEHLTSIGEYAFQNCQLLTEAAIPASCTAIGNYAFDGCQALRAFSVAEGNTSFSAPDGVLYTADGETLIRYPEAREETGYVVADTCKTLADWSFIGSMTLEQLDLGNVTQIGEDCFYYCTALKEITIPEGVTELPGAVFGYCLALQKVELPSSMKALGDHCFYACTKLESITIPEGVSKLGDQCFYNCVALLDLMLPSTITEVGDQALGYYVSAENSQTERIGKLRVHNAGSNAVQKYLRHWKSGVYRGWIIAGVIILVAAGAVTALVLVHRSRNRIRPASRQTAPAKGNAAKKRRKESKKS